MPRELRSRMPLDTRRTQLLDLGLRLFGTRAYDEVSIDDIAADAAVSKGLLYHYFGSKREFYVETIRHAADAFVEVIEHAQTLPSEARTLTALQGVVGLAEDRPESFVAMSTSGLGTDPEVAAIVWGARGRAIDLIAADLGFTDPRPILRMALRSYIGSVELALLDWIEHRDVDKKELVRFLVELLREAILAVLAIDPDAAGGECAPRILAMRRVCSDD